MSQLDSEEKDGLALLFCKWCPKDCQNLSQEERIGCLAASGFAEDLPVLKKIQEAVAESLFEHDGAGWSMRGRISFRNASKRERQDYRGKATAFQREFKECLKK